MIARSLPAHGGGGMERVTEDLVTRWARTGHSVTVVTTPFSVKPGDGSSDPYPGLLDVVTLPGRPGRYSSRWGKALARLSFDEFDVVFSVSSAARTLLGAKTTRPVVLQAHGTSLDEIRAKIANRSVRSLVRLPKNLFWLGRDLHDYARYDAVVGVGPAVTQTLTRTLPRRFRPRTYIELGNGVPKSAEDSEGAIRAGAVFVGRLHREKGVDLAVRAAVSAGVPLLICGDGPERHRLERLRDRLGSTSPVEFAGHLAPPEVRRAVRRAAVMLVPSRRREVGLNLAVLEALTEGTPVVISRALAESFGGDLPTGVTMADGVADLTAALRRTVDGTVDNALIAAGAVGFDVDRVAERYIDAFREVVAHAQEGQA
ncbi:glycosyltransferase family 4 protein [Xylanimonas allomyrinae]|uniref:glycosyltransferase family 4 protein n=1 Tax=Xylanimonas allomyrinae TaxID=2509459 RepID=UPI0013A67995|nr:glycosyltransferase family 4 protein [Xylanimonas allomyrinae]